MVLQNCEVEVATVCDPVTTTRLIPRVEIQCKNNDLRQLLTTTESYKSVSEAITHGAAMAHEWIDANVRA